MIHLENRSTVDKSNNGLSKRLTKFYEDNPEEELTYEDICTKFEVSYSQAKNAVQYLARSGLVEGVYLIRRKKSEDA